MHSDEHVLKQLKEHTPLYIELPFHTGDFLLIAHHKLIGHYRHVLKLMTAGTSEANLREDCLLKRKELHEEVLLQLNRALSLTLLSEEQLGQLRSFKILHEQLLRETTDRDSGQTN